MNKLIHYRNKCIGCGICYELQPELWRMSKKDGKATLINAIEKKNVFILKISAEEVDKSLVTAQMCPVTIIQLN
ncbi:ferredoxin [Chryseobacterium daecheongense]|uniref:Ferredoxin n=1 Tax=Chryseobacterium daecheongense TaxID=192389 RepID=A0A3N0VYI4_9FLAO|nr:ferredoxin [Chryseobacterium daecheongense]ROH97862.1 ferredoxin [Chryseobacterium daecheongense]TDX92962.1 ferredoxin [Chryseobacterium daecheongense]